MKLVILAFFLPQLCLADWCDIKDKKTNVVQYTYEGPCDQRKFGGPWGDPAQTVHVVNTTKQKELDDKKADEDQKNQKRDQRRARLETQCAAATGLLKEICDQLLDK